MALLIEHLTTGLAVAIASTALLCVCIALIRRRMKTNLVWERGLARPVVLDGIRRAIQVHRFRTGDWPTGKSDLRARVRVDERSLQTVGNWDIRLVTAGRDGATARYSIMVKDAWEDWDTDIAAVRSAYEGLRVGKARPRAVSRPVDSAADGEASRGV